MVLDLDISETGEQGLTVAALQMMARCQIRLQVQMMCYDQSSKCSTRADSSVSYVAAVVREAERTS